MKLGVRLGVSVAVVGVVDRRRRRGSCQRSRVSGLSGDMTAAVGHRVAQPQGWWRSAECDCDGAPGWWRSATATKAAKPEGAVHARDGVFRGAPGWWW